MSYYDDVYSKRIDRYGSNPAERIEGQRRENFERFLKQSPHATSFLYEDQPIPCVFEPYRQNETKTLMYVLCRASQKLKVGKVLEIIGDRYMVYYLDERKDSGYNRYVVLKMSHSIGWTDLEKNTQTSEAYLYLQDKETLRSDVRSGRQGGQDAVYLENLKSNTLVLPLHDKLEVGTYLAITTEGITQYFRVTGANIVSTPGVMYVGLAPTYERDLTPPPTQLAGEPDSDFFWLNGGK